MNTDLTLLFVGDPNLGMEGFAITRKYFKRASCLIWKLGDLAGERAIRAHIRSSRRDILLSFYSDLVFREDELHQAHIGLNIHPSGPRLRGVGYDTLPIIMEHDRHGVTLHHMTRDIDAGKIIDVIEQSLPDNVTHTQLRRLNQRLCLRMLRKTVSAIAGFRDIQGIYHYLNQHSEQLKAEWSPDYVSRVKLHEMLSALRNQEPDHRVFS